MFSLDIVGSEEFLSMPISCHALYFHLGMHADDDGFVNPKTVLRLTGSKEDDLKVLIAKRFVLVFETGIIVIKHWLIHNLIRLDRYKPTRYQNEKKLLFIKENKSYTEMPTNGSQIANQMAAQSRVEKSRVEKKRAPTSPEELKKQFFSDPLMEKVKVNYPDRDYGFQFDLMVNWWLANRGRLPKSLSAFSNWLKFTKPDEALQAERWRKLNQEDLEKKHKEMIETPKADDEKLKQLREKMGKIGTTL